MIRLRPYHDTITPLSQRDLIHIAVPRRGCIEVLR